MHMLIMNLHCKCEVVRPNRFDENADGVFAENLALLFTAIIQAYTS